MGRRAWGTVRRLPSGRYQARYPDASGKQVSAPHTFATKADGNRWLAKAQTEMDSGRWANPKAGKETLKVYGTTTLVEPDALGIDLTEFERDFSSGYARVNKRFAETVLPLIERAINVRVPVVVNSPRSSVAAASS